MKQLTVVGGLAAALTLGALITSAPPASAGCRPGAPWATTQCDGPVQPDGTWQRCVTSRRSTTGTRPSDVTYYDSTNCQTLGPDQHPLGIAFNDPPTHIDDDATP
jgi:hypothetical protein